MAEQKQMPKLSPKMRGHLEILSAGERAAYPSLSLGTLNALKGRGLVSARYGVGSIAAPHTTIKWSLTEAGRRATGAEG